MSAPVLATKLYIPPARPKLVARPQLIERLNEGPHSNCKLTLVSAPAGFGKTTLVSEWVAACERLEPEVGVAWLSLDDGDNDLTRFLVYVVAALQQAAARQGTAGQFGAGALGALQSPQRPSSESILTALLNEVAALPGKYVLVLDDYHAIDASPVDGALAYILEHLPPQLSLVLVTREDPDLPLARWRARGQLTELRVADLRFTPAEAASFLTQIMGLALSADDIAALEARTEGWIAGLQLAAVALQGTAAAQGQQDTASFLKSFTGSHRFVMDYLVEEVIQQQPDSVQNFLLRTSILDRLCGPLCDAVLSGDAGARPPASGQEMLRYLEQANLFIVSLDDERRWYRYHHLFADLLRQRLHQGAAPTEAGGGVAALHTRASVWLEDHGLELEAFQHAAAAQDFARAERLIEGKGMPLHFRGAVAPVLSWLASLPAAVLDAWPSLWTTYASVLLVTGQITRVEPTLQAAEAALAGAQLDAKTRDIMGRIAAIRATLAANSNQVETIIAESRRALEHLHPDNLAFRTSTNWKLGFAYHLQGDRTAAGHAYADVIAAGQASGNFVFSLLAAIGMGNLQQESNQLHQAAATFRQVLNQIGDKPLPFACEAALGLARIHYEWNDLEAADQHRREAARLAGAVENSDRTALCEVFLAQLKLARGDAAGALHTLAEAEQFVRQRNFAFRTREVAAAQLTALLHLGDLAAAARLAEAHSLPAGLARVRLAEGDGAAALAILEPLRQQAESMGWDDKRLQVMLLDALASFVEGDRGAAVRLLANGLALAEPGGFVRTFVDLGPLMAELLTEAAARGVMPAYAGRLLEALGAEAHERGQRPQQPAGEPLVEPLSQRELAVLQLIAQGLSNTEISERLFLALNTIKGYNQKIFGKLQVQRRTEAVARARELGLL